MWAIETVGLEKRYAGRAVVRDLNLQVGQGEVFGFLGPNGAGKSTTVKMLLGLVRPSGGVARVLGGDPADPRVRRAVGFLPEQFRFQSWMTAREFLQFHGRLAGLSSGELRARIPEVLGAVGLAGRGDEQLGGYSKGMQQRAGLAAALLARPRLVFLDEPTSALDPVGRVEVRRIIEALRGEGVTVFLNSHLLSEVEQVCDAVAFVRAGRVVRQGRVAELQGVSALTLRLSSTPPELLQALGALGTVRDVHPGGLTLELTDEGRLGEVSRAVHPHADLLALIPERVSLEQLFLELVGHPEAA